MTPFFYLGALWFFLLALICLCVKNLFTGGWYQDLFEYSISSNAWKRRADAPTARSGHSAYFTPDDKMIVFGGYNNQGGALQDLQIYDPMTDTWNTITPDDGTPPIPRYL